MDYRLFDAIATARIDSDLLSITASEKLQWGLNENTIFQENAFENVACKIPFIPCSGSEQQRFEALFQYKDRLHWYGISIIYIYKVVVRSF